MNSLNILSQRVSPPPSRSNSYSSHLGAITNTSNKAVPSEDVVEEKDEEAAALDDGAEQPRGRKPSLKMDQLDEQTPLLATEGELGEEAGAYTDPEVVVKKVQGWFYYPKRLATAFLNSLRIVFSALLAPGFYVLSLFYGPGGNFAPFHQAKRLGRWVWVGKKGRDPVSADAEKRLLSSSSNEGKTRRPSQIKKHSSSSSAISTESESDLNSPKSTRSPKNTRSKSRPTSESESPPSRRSIRIKLHSQETLRKDRARSPSSAATQSDGSGGLSPSADTLAAALKSPTSSSAITKYPRAPAPPRPLIPRRQPSYTLAEPISGRPPQKTLILDLDETLIHSIAKGGRMSSGHMVEVRLSTLLTPSGVPVQGPQHPILYYVHKRPHCDDFLRRCSKWYNLVVFTASVQEYADPVIDWLEEGRKVFSKRLYRQHCTWRHGAFIKDLSAVEPDLSRVMILDNSPLSYMFHQDNAIPVEGWINDPTDKELPALIPLLEALQHVQDVRAFLALRGGEDGKHMVA